MLNALTAVTTRTWSARIGCIWLLHATAACTPHVSKPAVACICGNPLHWLIIQAEQPISTPPRYWFAGSILSNETRTRVTVCAGLHCRRKPFAPLPTAEGLSGPTVPNVPSFLKVPQSGVSAFISFVFVPVIPTTICPAGQAATIPPVASSPMNGDTYGGKFCTETVADPLLAVP